MDAERLRLLKKLQPVFREKMGALTPTDTVCDTSEGNRVGTVLGYDEKIPVRVRFYWKSKNGYYYETNYVPSDETLLIPDVYSRDPDRPERGLIGMLDWSSVDLWMVAKDWCEIKYRQEVIARGPLDLALLRALDKEGGR
jgi:hypothetical protein